MSSAFLRAGSLPLSASRRGSEISEGLPSPPSSRPTSPSPRLAASPESELSPASPATLSERADIVVDAEPRFSGPRSGSLIERKDVGRRPSALALGSAVPTSHARHPAIDTDVSMEADLPTPASEPESATRPPARLLEDERSHVHRSGTVTLKDFEVQGALGM
jgi:hypothetical protein